VRLGIACVQGLALGANVPVLSVISLDSIAMQAVLQMDVQGNNDKELLVILDARMGEVYWARYRLQASLPVRLSAPQLALPADIALEKITWVVGSGVNLCSAAVQALALSDISANALGVLACARQQLAAGLQHDVRLLEPLYVRDKVAFTSAERAGKTLPIAAQ
jgi:tRNA threonylcarbamoyladenosine biosynthesis protein TsaB